MNDSSSIKLPRHIAIIMDGNGRWAQKRNLSRPLGHRQGAKAVEATIKAALRHKIKTLSLFAFSTENWGRPSSEVDLLWKLLAQSVDDNLPKLDQENVRIKFIGDLSALDNSLVVKLKSAEQKTANNSRLNLLIAINYSGRQDIIQSAKKLAESTNANWSEQEFSKHLTTAEFGDIDLLIRTSGERRLSNFMLWQCAYAELYFTECKWPDFSAKELDLALDYYTQCERRFGLLSCAEADNA